MLVLTFSFSSVTPSVAVNRVGFVVGAEGCRAVCGELGDANAVVLSAESVSLGFGRRDGPAELGDDEED